MTTSTSDAPVPAAAPPHAVSIVVPVYGGERTLGALLEEIAVLTAPGLTPAGHPVVVSEVLLVHDHGPDDSASVIRALADRYPFVRPVWLSRNFGQHPATLAGMASSGGEWVATLDEDGQHDPRDVHALLDAALADGADVVYAAPTNEASHGFARNAASRGSKRLMASLLGRSEAPLYQSFRLVLGEVARSVAAYAGPGVYLDVALGWIAHRTTTAPVRLRDEGDRTSGYSLRSLLSHFWRMVVSSGTRPLRFVSVLGVVFAVLGVLLALVLVVARLVGNDIRVQGWTSTMIVVLLSTGALLFSLGVIAEYLGVAVNMAMGKPLYVIVGDSARGPLGRREVPRPAAAATRGPVRAAAPRPDGYGTSPAQPVAAPPSGAPRR